ncbi:hypothetical protein DL546_009687 [Coniochaeta pulveracea]|uniref:CHY-type domain-containing protein n=1 Tax=Coniochaeta pulveracea TaxID=177199 RepID=A0A420YLJ5_9PEZI|nr:hypothetical protein DL546_009687 [Coniochaeta pulveracea]
MISTRPHDEVGARRDKQAVHRALPTRVVPKPVAQSEVKDPREYQLGQIRRRYSPRESKVDGDTSLVFKLVPSDPDFPFELEFLECDLRVPRDYPNKQPKLLVKNKDIPRGFAINIERGWDKLRADRPNATLLATANALDKKLETLLSEQKTETVKLTIFKDTRHEEAKSTTGGPVQPPPQPAKPAPEPRRYVSETAYTREQVAEAKARRAQEIRQLEARMSRVGLFQKSSDGIIYTLPLEVKRRDALPAGLQGVKSCQLIIPLLYPLQSLRVILNDVESSDAEGVEELFTEKAAEQRQMSLMSHLNYLASSLHILAKQAATRANKSVTHEVLPPSEDSADVQAKGAEHIAQAQEKGHVHVIPRPRPPEWQDDHDDGTDDSEEDYSEDTGDEGGADLSQGRQAQEPTTTTGPVIERGIAVMFPSLEMHGLELLQLSSMDINIKCSRCKTVNEITGLKNGAEKQATCKKCAAPFGLQFRPEFMHEHSHRAGFLEVAGCTVADLLPSTFIPTCSSCSTAAQGRTAVRGDKVTNVCRSCHQKFSFALGPEVKFLPYAPGTSVHLPTGPARKQTDKLGLHAGSPLPENGACAHYRKSYRWFRFGCCGRVHPCDKCHDAAEGHANEWAPRMICGFCSREQRYNPESCSFCGRSVIGRKGSGYWEGGKGTRDKTLMRKGDKRKYKRVGGGEQRKDKKKD